MEIPWTAKQTKLCFLFINCAIGRLFNSSTNPRTVTLRPLGGAMSEEAWRIILSLSPCFLDPLFAAPVPSPSPPDRRVADSSSVVFSCRNCAGGGGIRVFSSLFSFFFFFLWSVWSMEPWMKTTGGRKERRRASALKKMTPLVCFKCSSCM